MERLSNAIEWARLVLWDEPDDAPDYLKCSKADGPSLVGVVSTVAVLLFALAVIA